MTALTFNCLNFCFFFVQNLDSIPTYFFSLYLHSLIYRYYVLRIIFTFTCKFCSFNDSMRLVFLLSENFRYIILIFRIHNIFWFIRCPYRICNLKLNKYKRNFKRQLYKQKIFTDNNFLR